ncbi:MAG: vWA domain-containing protein [Pseudomonadales bacterium]
MDLTALHFIRPSWLLALIPVALLTIAWVRGRGAGSHWESSIAPALLNVLLEPGSRGPSRRLPWIVGLALGAGAIGLAGPTWERLPQPVEQKTDALVIVLDLSLSMFAEDVAPSRLVRARQKIADVLRLRDEGFTALVAYAGDAHAVVPLTDDVRTIENLLPALSPEMMPVFGSNLATALEQAHILFENAGVGQGRILLVTDGVDRLSDAAEYASRRFPISVLGVGTPAGATIPLDFANQPGQVLRTQLGDPVVARLDEARLRSVADVGHGRYRTLGLGSADIEHLLDTRLPGDDETVEVERNFDVWADMGFWVVILLLPIVLLGFRRGVVALAPLALAPLLLLPMPAEAGIWDDLWQRRDQQAFQALRDGDPDAAAANFADPAWRAAALYRNGDYQAAADSFRRQESLAAQYNLGNALARQGEYRRAIEAYDQVLAADPQHDDASFNKALVEKLLEQQESAEQDNDEQQQQSDGEPESSSQPQNDSDGGQGDQEEQSGEPPPEAEQPPEPNDSDPADSQPEQDGQEEQDELSSRDEQQDALEQWLRRVPDDPGGLLRRKFQHETNQRMRRGDYRSQEAEKIW